MSDERSARRRGLRAVVLVVIVALLSVVAVTVLQYVFRSEPGARSIDDGVEDFRRRQSTTVVDPAAATIPESGVYALSGQGSAEISFPPSSQQDGAEIPATITHDGTGCFTMEVGYNEARSQTLSFCRDGALLRVVGLRTRQAWDFGSLTVENQSTSTCTGGGWPLDGPAGTTSTFTCSGSNSATPGALAHTVTVEVLGAEDIRVGDRDLSALRLRESVEVSGAQSGANRIDWWIDGATALPLRNDHQIRITSASPVGDVTYTEIGGWSLTDSLPRR